MWNMEESIKDKADKQNKEEVSERRIKAECGIGIAVVSSITAWISTLAVLQDKPLFWIAGITGILCTILAIWINVKFT
jgi:hypothetical protein